MDELDERVDSFHAYLNSALEQAKERASQYRIGQGGSLSEFDNGRVDAMYEVLVMFQRLVTGSEE